MKYWLRNIILLSFITVSGNTKAQSYSEVVNNLSVRFAPLSLIDFYNGSSYKLGFEKKLFQSTSFHADFGGYFKNFNGLKNCTGFNADIGLRYYFIDKQINQGTYLTLNYFYKEQGFNKHDSIQSNPTYFKEYRTQKYVTCLNLNIGYLEIFYDRLILDVFGGFGVRFKKVNSTLQDEEFENAIYYSDSQSDYFIVRPGKYVRLNFNVRFRVAYRIF